MNEQNRTLSVIFDSRHGSREILNLMSEKWTILVLSALTYGVKRHGELKREVKGISQKMLTQTLRNLEHDGFVERTSYPTNPPRVEYALTPLGETFGTLLKEICLWAETHYSEVLTARKQFEDKSLSDVV